MTSSRLTSSRLTSREKSTCEINNLFLPLTKRQFAVTMHPKNISIHDYTYALPTEKIAFHPLEKRDQSKLLIYNNGDIQTDFYSGIANHLPPDSLIVFNDTKVMEARLLFKKPTGATIEIFCLEHGTVYPDISTAMTQRGTVQWQCLIGGASKWKPGQILEKHWLSEGKEQVLYARYDGKNGDCFNISFSWEPYELSFAEILHQAGVMPLPPYIKREATTEDAGRYQTIYADKDGSVAAPTAGLHFTDAIMNSLKNKNIETSYVTLHVGAGTFKPVKASIMEDHSMHSEYIDIRIDTLKKLIDYTEKDITAVGTTSLRTLESLYWMGVKSLTNPSITIDEISINQWDAYELAADNISTSNALNGLMEWMQRHQSERLITTTRLLIAPGYKIRIANRLVTNFHQPQSTLLLLVAAFIGDDWRKVYDFALENDFRFLSYGDGCLLQRV